MNGRPEARLSKVVFTDLYLNQKKTLQEIANFFGVAKSTAQKYRGVYGLPARTLTDVRLFKKWGPTPKMKEDLAERTRGRVGEAHPNWKGGISVQGGRNRIY